MKGLIKRGISIQGFIILDDSLSVVDWNSKFWNQLLYTVRQYNLSLFILAQYFNKLPAEIRAQASQFFFTKMMLKRKLIACYENCFPFMEYKQFLLFVKQNTSGYSCIFVNNHALTNSESELYKIICAPEYIPPFYLNF